MSWYHSVFLAAFASCLIGFFLYLRQYLRLGFPEDHSVKKGDLKSGVAYSFLGAMNPVKKESAYLHLPTYVGGVLYHLGTFASGVLLIVFFFDLPLSDAERWPLIVLLAVSGFSGIGMLIKRCVVGKVNALSSPDDYISNLLVTVFQFLSLGMIIDSSSAPAYFLSAAVLLFYVPIGKLKHVYYFFAARYHLGVFYGWRGVWPARRI